MNLDDAQKQKVAGWIEEGCKLADIQSRLEAEFGHRLTYMEVKLLVDDLKLMPKDQPQESRKVLGSDPLTKGSEAAGPSPGTGPETGRVAVTVDQLARPGALVSGNVRFSDGKSADWQLDQFGRLAVVPKQQGYKPSQADVQEFQMALQNELAKLGL